MSTTRCTSLTGVIEHKSALPEAGLPANPWEVPGVDVDGVPRELTGILLATIRKLLVTGQGGCGKTYVVAKALIAAGVDFVIACPSNELAIEHAKNLGCRTSTYHKLLALPVAKPISTWDPSTLGHKLDRLRNPLGRGWDGPDRNLPGRGPLP